MNASPVVLVTGGARRVGAEIARTLHAAGAVVMLHYRHSAAEAERLVAELNARRPQSAASAAADLCDVAAAGRLVAATIARFGRLDALVNNASSFFATPLGGITEAAWDDLVGSNLKGPLFLAQAAAPHLAAAGGAMVNIVDIHAERPLKGYPLYCAAKAGLLGLTRALAVELGPQVRVNAVAPGAIEWPQGGADFPPDERVSIVGHTLLKRVGAPADIARTVNFLIFDAPYITGQVINVDGGRTAHL
ncbi:MAG: pteridine reductase [Rhodocyclaceae bacterium]|nr:pteridine reductase [Rhodocyclaceae bacterium]